MSHTYANLDEFKRFLTDGGTNYGTANDTTLLDVLDGASRAADDYAQRSDYGSGFGPRTASNRYEGDGSACLDLADDFQSFTSVSVYVPPTAVAATYTLTENTDYYPRPYSGPPYTEIELHGYGQIGAFPHGSRIVVAGTAGYATKLVSVAATMGTVTATATSVVITGAGVSVGATMRVDSEDLYVTATTAGTAFATAGGTATVLRGQNGTTAAVHSAGSAISVHDYISPAKSATLRIAQRRWRSRDAGLTGDMGGGDIPVTGNRDTERSILRSTLGRLKRYGAA